MPTGETPILAADNVVVTFPLKSAILRRVVGHVQAVSGASLHVGSQETVALVGESGCGKTTLSRALAGLITPASGTVTFQGNDLAALSRRQLRQVRRDVQLIFQDPYASLNPRRTVRQIIEEPWEVHPDILPKARRRDRVMELLELVGLGAEHADRYPHQFSGGQQQRIGVARALALQPKVLICDEPVSALDVSIQGQIIRLLLDLQQRFGLSYVFVAHDLAVVRMIAHRVAVMYLGKIAEIGDTESVFVSPTHPYTQALLSAVPIADPAQVRQRNRILLSGDLPSPANPPSGCIFRTRCRKAADVCAQHAPDLEQRGTSHASACHFAADDGRGVPISR